MASFRACEDQAELGQLGQCRLGAEAVVQASAAAQALRGVADRAKAHAHDALAHAMPVVLEDEHEVGQSRAHPARDGSMRDRSLRPRHAVVSASHPRTRLGWPWVLANVDAHHRRLALACIVDEVAEGGKRGGVALRELVEQILGNPHPWHRGGVCGGVVL